MYIIDYRVLYSEFHRIVFFVAFVLTVKKEKKKQTSKYFKQQQYKRTSLEQ